MLRRFWFAGGVLLLCLATSSFSQAQVTTDGTLPTPTHVEPSSDRKNFTIIGGSQDRGGNLFHSFREFSVPTDGSAIFLNDSNIRNIISRVTGGSISNIDGLIKANGSASLFLINPSGIIFGPNARLDIKGSFIASTAEQMNFDNGSFFNATGNLQTPPLLTVNIPIGLQFRETQGRIVNQSRVLDLNNPNPQNPIVGLQVMPENTLALVGGDVLLEGGVLTAHGGRIEIGSVAGSSVVSLTSITEGWALGYDGVQNFQEIRLSQLAVINTSAISSISKDGISFIPIDRRSGNILLRGGRISITEESQVAAINFGADLGGSITIKASESVEVSTSLIFSRVADLTGKGTGRAGNITIETRGLHINNSVIDSSVQGKGQGGNLTVYASELVEIDAQGIFGKLATQALGNSSGNAGNLQIITGRLILRDGGQISTSTDGTGSGGTITVNASDSIEISSQGITSDNKVRQSGLLATSEDRATGNGGTIDVNTNRLLIRDNGTITVAAIEGSTGQAGNLTINASKLTLQNEATISASTISSQGGNISLNLKTLDMNDSEISASTVTGQAGNLNIYATDTVNVNGGSRLSVEALSKDPNDGGAAGNLTLTANSLNLNQGTITAVTQEPGNEGANIRLRVADIIKLQNESQISATSTGTANGGNITIDTRFLIAYPPEGSNGSDITADSNRGAGGKIDITAQGVFGTQIRDNQTSNNDITAISKLNPNLNGVIDFNTPDIDPTRGLVQFPTIVINPAILIEENYCIQQDVSQLVISGRGGLPPSIIENISDRAIEIELVKPVNSPETQPQNRTKKRKSTTQVPIIPARGWVYNKYGEVVLTAYDPTAKASLPHRDKESVCPVR